MSPSSVRASLKSVPATRFEQNSECASQSVPVTPVETARSHSPGEADQFRTRFPTSSNRLGKDTIPTNTEMSTSKGSTATESFVPAKVSTIDRIKKYSRQHHEVQLAELKSTVDRIKKYSRQTLNKVYLSSRIGFSVLLVLCICVDPVASGSL